MLVGELERKREERVSLKKKKKGDDRNKRAFWMLMRKNLGIIEEQPSGK